ncbi:hypothetical protein BMI_I821 [Brucella microti CCM 4915]|uniref:Uncharacterized protein n=1 Tax=Brucella microti (strain BCCN 7-01 / CAPM 6434 / CCM 4915) TaxID=568815 RepID=C7LBC6_BRUMC|nr:hypothetical protein BMI_I821 [Brucella microti CCM 4915]
MEVAILQVQKKARLSPCQLNTRSIRFPFYWRLRKPRLDPSSQDLTA